MGSRAFAMGIRCSDAVSVTYLALIRMDFTLNWSKDSE